MTDPMYGNTDDINRSAKVHAQLLAHFWHRWKTDQLTAQREFHQTTGNNAQTAKVGDIVLIHDNVPRVQWKLAVIEGVNKGAYRLIRPANVCTSTGGRTGQLEDCTHWRSQLQKYQRCLNRVTTQGMDQQYQARYSDQPDRPPCRDVRRCNNGLILFLVPKRMSSTD